MGASAPVQRICFVLAEGQNHFFVELVEALRDELEQQGVASEISRDGFPPPSDGMAYVLVPPHEHLALATPDQRPTRRQLARTVLLCAEQPGTKFFDANVAVARAGAGAVLDINADAVAEHRLLGVDAHHAPVGWTRTWTRERSEPRDVDVVHLGVLTPRRARAVARYGPAFQNWTARMLFSDPHAANSAGRPGFLSDDDKWALLARSRVLVNVHAEPRSYFETLRVVQAMCNGVLVVTEHSSGIAPLEPGTHLVSGRVEVLDQLAARYLEDEDARRAMAGAAFDLLRRELPLRDSALLLAEAAERVARAPAALPSGADPDERVASPLGAAEPRSAARWTSPVADRETSAVRVALKDLRLDVLALRRQVARLQLEARSGVPAPDAEVVGSSEAHARAEPRISVLVPVYDHAEHVRAALGSVAAAGRQDVEVVAVDDGSADATGAAIDAFLAEHPELPVLHVRHPVNRGLGAARNSALEHARGAFVFMLDADNEILPPCLDRLEATLEADAGAAFAYPILAMHEQGEPVGLRSALAWDPELLRSRNPIDAMALWRTDRIRELGGYTTDRRLHGWEDYDLWCRAAERGEHGVQVPQVLARYRVGAESMLSLTDISFRSAVALLVERYPRVMGGVEPPL